MSNLLENHSSVSVNVRKQRDEKPKRGNGKSQVVLNRELFAAIRAGDVEKLERLLDSGANIETTKSGDTPLLWALGAGDFRCFDALVRRGAKLNAYSKLYRNTPLMHAIVLDRPQFVKRLLEADPDLGQVAVGGCYPLVYSTNLGRRECVRELLDSGVYVGWRGALRDALVGAAKGGFTDIVDLLLQYGARHKNLDILETVNPKYRAMIEQMHPRPTSESSIRGKEDEQSFGIRP